MIKQRGLAPPSWWEWFGYAPWAIVILFCFWCGYMIAGAYQIGEQQDARKLRCLEQGRIPWTTWINGTWCVDKRDQGIKYFKISGRMKEDRDV